MDKLEPEELIDELKPHITGEGIKRALKHPLIYVVPYLDIENKRINEAFKLKKRKIEQAIQDQDWVFYVALHEKPYRLDAIRIIDPLIKTNTLYWHIVRETWIICENVWEQKKEWYKILTSKRRGDPKQFMPEEDRKVWDNLPDKITIYRGHQGINKKGFSWTLKEKTALWFAKRFESKTAWVEIKTVNKKDCFAYLSIRGEDEIIYLKGNLR